MIIQALVTTNHGGIGVSIAKIAKYLQQNYSIKLKGAQFNSHLRRVLSAGLNHGILCHGKTNKTIIAPNINNTPPSLSGTALNIA